MDAKEYLLKINAICGEVVEDYEVYADTWKSKLLEILPLAQWDKRCPSDFFGDVAINQDCQQECINVDDETCMKCWERAYVERGEQQ